MSRTDKDRPFNVQWEDPHNRRFMKIGCPFWPEEYPGKEWPWKKLTPATPCWCCSGRYWKQWHRQQRHEAQRMCREALKGEV